MDLARLLERFAALARPGPWLHRHEGPPGAVRVHLQVCTHGDEIGPLPAAVELLEALVEGRWRPRVHLSLAVGNPEAVRAGVRGLDSDLNRVFLPSPPDDREGRRARELMPVLDDVDVLLDLHQTGAPTASAFYILPWDEAHARWVRALGGAPMWITRPPDQGFSPSTCCVDEYVRQRGRIGLTLELSQKGPDPATAQAALGVMRRLVELAEDPRRLAAEAEARPEPGYLVLSWREPMGEPTRRLREGLRNLQPVEQGQLLSPDGAPALPCPVGGYLLFPKYPPRDAQGRVLPPVPEELFRIVVPPAAHPRDLWASPASGCSTPAGIR